MDHSPYIRHAENSRFAVLMVHGIVGSPAHFRDLLPVIPQDWSVYNILLEGHGGTVEDFSSASMKKWKQQVADTLQLLFSRHEKVLFVGHSMGTLFAIKAAIDHPNRIAGLFLLGVPLRPWVRFSTLIAIFRVSLGKIRPQDRIAQAMKNDSSVQMNPRLWKYLPWTPIYIGLLAECRRIRKVLPQLSVPTLAFQSNIDELVSMTTCKDLAGHPCIQTTVLYDSGHFCYGPEDTRLLQNRLKDSIQMMPDL